MEYPKSSPQPSHHINNQTNVQIMKKIPDEVKKNLYRLQKYCAREDRSTQRIRERLYSIKELSHNEKEWIIDQLTQDRFLDDERFASTFVRSKVNQNRWGVEKIGRASCREREELAERARAVAQAT